MSIAGKAIEIAANTQTNRQKRKEIKLFIKFLVQKGIKYLPVTSQTIQSYFDHRCENKNGSLKTWDTMSTILKRLEKYLDTVGYKNKNPVRCPKICLLLKGYKQILIENRKVRKHIPAAPISAVKKAIKYFQIKSSLGCKNAAKMHVILCLALHRGMRCSDILRLKWEDLKFTNQAIYINPVDIKNARINTKWRFTIKKAHAPKYYPLDSLKRIPKDNNKIFGKWKVQNVSYQLEKIKNVVGTKLTVHQIRVALCIMLTKNGWTDSDIKMFFNWASEKSMNNYRLGLDIKDIKALRLPQFEKGSNLADFDKLIFSWN